MNSPDQKLNAQQIDHLRDRLFPFAYHLLGDAEEAKDAVSEALTRYLERENLGENTQVQNPEAYLYSMVRNQAIDRLNQKKRTEYPGPWLPEPIFVEENETENSLDCGFAMALLLGKLTPNERAVFLMKECFGFGHQEIAAAFDLSEDNSRKILQRSKEKIGGEGIAKNQGQLAEKGKLLQAFMGAVQSGDLDSLQALLKEDMVLYSDGGGKVKAARKPVLGRLNAFKFLNGLLRKGSEDETPPEFRPLLFGNEVYVLVTSGPDIDSLVSFEVENGSISNIYIQRNPDKLKNIKQFVTK